MTERMIYNRIKKLDEIAAQQKELEAQAEAIRNEIKEDMQEKGVDELIVLGRIARFKEIISNRFDSTTFKKEHADMYTQYCKQSVSKRLTLA